MKEKVLSDQRKHPTARPDAQVEKMTRILPFAWEYYFGEVSRVARRKFLTIPQKHPNRRKIDHFSSKNDHFPSKSAPAAGKSALRARRYAPHSSAERIIAQLFPLGAPHSTPRRTTGRSEGPTRARREAWSARRPRSAPVRSSASGRMRCNL